MARITLAPLTQWITAASLAHADDLPAEMMARLAISRRSAGHWLRRLVAAQWLVTEGSRRRPRYRPGALRQVVQRYAIDGLQEDLPWRRDFAPCFELPPEVLRMAQHAFTELLNNAIDHSGGSSVVVSVRQTPLQLQLLVSDDGLGVFERIAQTFAIDEPSLAMFELAKGKLSTNPERHSGHGLFFCSRLAEVFDIHANEAAFQCRNWSSSLWQPGRPAIRRGTSVYLAIALDTPRTLDAVLRGHSQNGQAYAFERTVVPLHLLGIGSGPAGAAGLALASRAEARRVAERLGRFRSAEIDFSGIGEIGHGFADELFRVFRRDHPALELVPTGMAPRVAAMLASLSPA